MKDEKKTLGETTKEDLRKILNTHRELSRLAFKCGAEHARIHNRHINSGPALCQDGSIFYEMTGTLDGGDGVDDIIISAEDFVEFINKNYPNFNL